MRNLISVTIIIVFFSCNCCSKQRDKILLYNGKSTANHQLIYLSTQFINDSNSQNYIHQLFIDKINPDYYNLTLRDIVKNKKNSENNNSLNFIEINNQRIYLYSGIEDFFYTDPLIESKIDTTSFNERTWTVLIKGDSAKIYKDNVGIPFLQRDNDVIDGIDTTRWIYLPRDPAIRDM